MHKIEKLKDGQWVRPDDPSCYAREQMADGTQRLFGHVPVGDALVFLQLASALSGPYLLLYVLHTPRGEAEPGRYQSDPLSAEELAALLTTHREFLAADARFDIWAHSRDDNSTVVWDRHNQLYCYGDLAKLEPVLKAAGFAVRPPQPVGPHKHFYRPEMDPLAASFLAATVWHWSPLKPEDEQ